jgi:hypothetical protein
MRFERTNGIGSAAVGVALLVLAGAAAAGTCPPPGCVGDANGDGMVQINELIIAVNNALDGCPPAAQPLGTRTFTIAPVSASLRTGLFSTALLGNNVATTITDGPITIVGGAPDANGIAPLSLAEDATFNVRVLDGSGVCFKMLAAGSSGTIDCDGGTPADVSATADPGPEASPMLTTGQGADAGPGAATLLVTLQSVQLPVGTSIDTCATAEFSGGAVTAFTTATATATKGATMISRSGENFDCGTFTTSDGPGVLVAPSVAYETRAGGDLSSITSLADQ